MGSSFVKDTNLYVSGVRDASIIACPSFPVLGFCAPELESILRGGHHCRYFNSMLLIISYVKKKHFLKKKRNQ